MNCRLENISRYQSKATSTSLINLSNNELLNRKFYPVGGENLDKMEIIAEIFNRILTPLYGSQAKAIQQIRESSDRRCYLLYEGETPSGVLMFKTVLSNEFAEFGIRNSIEIKSLFVDNAAQNSGKGLGSALVDKLKEESAKLALGESGIHVTVSETKQDSLLFFRKKGFEITHAWKNKYIQGVTEYLLFCPTRIREQASEQMGRVTQSFNETHISNKTSEKKSESRKIYECFHVIKKAHLDDIHALKKLSDGTFVSGSKDNSLYKWSERGDLVSVVDEVEPSLQSERNWITAIQVLNDEYWLSGQRNGQISLWKTNGGFVREIKLPLPKIGTHVSHMHNARRVTCLAAGLDAHKPSFFVGFPTMFDEFNFIEGRTSSSTKVSPNDWMYCIHPLTKESILGVVAATVGIWSKTEVGWNLRETLIEESFKERHHRGVKVQRPFVSDLKPLVDSPNHFGLSLLNGQVKVLDISSRGKIVQEWNEHQGRVWSIEPIGPNTFASSGEDRSIRFWDQRHGSGSVHTIADHVGQVTSMLSLNDHILIAGTCPERALESIEGAQIRFYDLRK